MDEALPDDATVILHVSKGRQLPKDADICESIDQDAFRCDDDGISVTWVEYFDGQASEQFHQAAHAMKGAMKLRKSGVIVTAKVADIKAVLAEVGVSVEVVTDPQLENEAHCLIKGIQPENLTGLLALTQAFPRAGFIQCDTVEGLVG
ncbi:hypothetical protein P6144_08965 [Sphingomonas sp. HITSZ_GF]|uniref:hypothetical protein n=1 Tax=Sphingomonas sp. HITSZ_GF TaxID=3037247 RepID=UPI00240DE709|nr:hypothetical protein [Sphingomonas sp. HITSZ_GF]MDG2533775.1 hypothetical protein [Sphingomonas sp. HITSZ_GF]